MYNCTRPSLIIEYKIDEEPSHEPEDSENETTPEDSEDETEPEDSEHTRSSDVEDRLGTSDLEDDHSASSEDSSSSSSVQKPTTPSYWSSTPPPEAMPTTVEDTPAPEGDETLAPEVDETLAPAEEPSPPSKDWDLKQDFAELFSPVKREPTVEQEIPSAGPSLPQDTKCTYTRYDISSEATMGQSSKVEFEPHPQCVSQIYIYFRKADEERFSYRPRRR